MVKRRSYHWNDISIGFLLAHMLPGENLFCSVIIYIYIYTLVYIYVRPFLLFRPEGCIIVGGENKKLLLNVSEMGSKIKCYRISFTMCLNVNIFTVSFLSTNRISPVYVLPPVEPDTGWSRYWAIYKITSAKSER